MEFMLTCKLYFYMICIYAEIKIKSFNLLAYTAKQSCNYNYLHALVHLEATWGHLPPLKFPKIYIFFYIFNLFYGKRLFFYINVRLFITVKNLQPILEQSKLGAKGIQVCSNERQHFLLKDAIAT